MLIHLMHSSLVWSGGMSWLAQSCTHLVVVAVVGDFAWLAGKSCSPKLAAAVAQGKFIGLTRIG